MPKVPSSSKRFSSANFHYRNCSVPGQGTKNDPFRLEDDEERLYEGSRLWPIPIDGSPVPSPVIPTDCAPSKPASLREMLRNKKNMVFITGAGISTSAGIEDFQSHSRKKTSSQKLFDISTPLEEFANHVGLLNAWCATQNPTPFHHFLDELASTHRVLRHYTQNIDCLDSKLDNLSRTTVLLHGRLDTVNCTVCLQAKVVMPVDYESTVLSPCRSCVARSEEREAKGKRGLSIGTYKPKILRYGEDCSDDIDILAAFNSDIGENVDAVVIAGTQLKAPSLKRFAHALCARTKSRGGMVVWVNRNKPKLGLGFNALFDYTLDRGCDEHVM